jgi:hypothetical protein
MFGFHKNLGCYNEQIDGDGYPQSDNGLYQVISVLLSILYYILVNP